MSKAETARILHRAGYPAEVVRELLDQLEDPVDFDRDDAVLARYQVDREHLTDLMGGSP
jgi:hypothetical protein